MKTLMSSKRLRTLSLWLLGASLAAALLAASTVLNPIYADDEKSGDESLDSRSASEVGTDMWIMAKVKSSLLADQQLSGFSISVESRRKVVFLSGEVANQSQVNYAVELVEKIEDVDSVDAASLRIATAADPMRAAVRSTD